MIPAASEKCLQLCNIGECLILWHIVTDKFKKTVNKRAAKQMNELRRSSSGTDHIVPGMLDVQQRIVFLDLHNLIDEACKTCPLTAADDELERIPAVIYIVDDLAQISSTFLVICFIMKELLLCINWLCVIGLLLAHFTNIIKHLFYGIFKCRI